MSIQQILDEAIGDSPPSRVSVDDIVRRERRRARIRTAVAAAAAVGVVSTGVVAGMGGGVQGWLTVGPDTAAQAPIEYFPEYVAGARVIAEASAPLSEGRLTLTFTPSVAQEDLTILVRCEVDADVDFVVEVGVGAGTVTSTVTSASARDDSCEQERFRPSPGWATFARVGEETTISATVTFPPDGPAPPGTFGLAVGEPVPFADYPLPARPWPVPPLDPEIEIDPAVDYGQRWELRADPADPGGRAQEVRLPCPERLLILVRAQTPGELHIHIDGVPVGRVAVWDYGQQEQALDLGASGPWGQTAGPLPGSGQDVTVTVVPEHMTGDWVAVLLLDPTGG